MKIYVFTSAGQLAAACVAWSAIAFLSLRISIVAGWLDTSAGLIWALIALAAIFLAFRSGRNTWRLLVAGWRVTYGR